MPDFVDSAVSTTCGEYYTDKRRLYKQAKQAFNVQIVFIVWDLAALWLRH